MPTATKRTQPEDAEIRSHKKQRTTNSTNGVVQQQAVRPTELWETICKTELQTLREIVYHATLANIDPQLSLRVLNTHHIRVHNEAVQAEQARKNQELRDRRDRKKITDFDHHFRQIDSWVANDPIDRKACRISYGIYEKILARIAKIEEKALESTTNFQTKCNALDTLRKIVDTILYNEGGAMGIEIYEYTNTNRSIEGSMLKVLRSMTRHERDELLTVKYDGSLWVESMTSLDAYRQTKSVYFGNLRDTKPFPGISDVLEFVYGPVAVQTVEDHAAIKEEGIEE